MIQSIIFFLAALAIGRPVRSVRWLFQRPPTIPATVDRTSETD
jgi:hypothetical protein